MAVERVSSSFYTLRLLIIDGDTKTTITDVLFTIVQNTPRKYCVFLNAQTLFTRWQLLPKFRNVDPVLRPLTLTFDLSTTKWGHGSLVSWAFFLPIISLHPSILDLGSGTGQSDGQTDDGHQSSMSPPYGAGA